MQVEISSTAKSKVYVTCYTENKTYLLIRSIKSSFTGTIIFCETIYIDLTSGKSNISHLCYGKKWSPSPHGLQ